MNVYEKYSGLSDSPIRAAALRAFSAAVNGRKSKMLFKMATDEQMKAILDEGDYALWLKIKSESVGA